jgi:hypothetical protein
MSECAYCGMPCSRCSEWEQDSSLEKWFPMTAALMKQNEVTIKSQQDYIIALHEIIDKIKNRNKN